MYLKPSPERFEKCIFPLFHILYLHLTTSFPGLFPKFKKGKKAWERGCAFKPFLFRIAFAFA